MTRFQSRSNLQRATVKGRNYQKRVDVTERNREFARLAEQARLEWKAEQEARRAALANGEGNVIPDNSQENHT